LERTLAAVRGEAEARVCCRFERPLVLEEEKEEETYA